MGYSEARRGGGPAVEDFKSAFQKIAVFLGRPSSPTALFSGVPFDETAVTVEDVSHLADKIGLDTRQQRINDMVTGRLVLPALLLLADGSAIALLDRTEQGSFVTLLDSPERANIADLL